MKPTQNLELSRRTRRYRLYTLAHEYVLYITLIQTMKNASFPYNSDSVAIVNSR